jgi:hypothetical protein
MTKTAPYGELVERMARGMYESDPIEHWSGTLGEEPRHLGWDELEVATRHQIYGYCTAALRAIRTLPRRLEAAGTTIADKRQRAWWLQVQHLRPEVRRNAEPDIVNSIWTGVIEEALREAGA